MSVCLSVGLKPGQKNILGEESNYDKFGSSQG